MCVFNNVLSFKVGNLNNPSGSPVRRPQVLTITTKPKQTDNLETEEKLREIMRISGNITINGRTYKTDIKDMEEIEELGNGTCGHVIKMRHKPSGEIIAVKVICFECGWQLFQQKLVFTSKCGGQGIQKKVNE